MPLIREENYLQIYIFLNPVYDSLDPRKTFILSEIPPPRSTFFQENFEVWNRHYTPNDLHFRNLGISNNVILSSDHHRRPLA